MVAMPTAGARGKPLRYPYAGGRVVMVISAVCLCLRLYVYPRFKKETTSAINTKLGPHTGHGSRWQY